MDKLNSKVAFHVTWAASGKGISGEDIYSTERQWATSREDAIERVKRALCHMYNWNDSDIRIVMVTEDNHV